MEFLILGPLEVRDGGTVVPIAGSKQRLLLALLLADQGRRVSRDAITETLWPDRPPGDAAHALDLQISRLRKLVGAQRLVTSDGGYRLELAGDDLDAERFAALVREATEGPPEEATALLRDALGLWRGPAFGPLGGELALRSAADALEDRRLAAWERLFDAELGLGHHDAILGELELLTAAEPLRERLHEQRMIALYRSARQADALAVYDDLRRRLSEELGIDPGERIRRLHEEILRQDPALSWRMPAPAGRPQRPASRRTARVLGGVGVAATLAVLALVLVAGGDDDSPREPGAAVDTRVAEQHLAFIDVRDGAVLASLPIGDDGAMLAQTPDFDWLVTASGTLLQFDPRSRRRVRSVSLGFEPGGQGLAAGLGSLWVVAKDRPVLLRLDPVYGTVEDRYRLPTGGTVHGNRLFAVAVAGGSVWVAQGEERVLRIDPQTGRTLSRIRAPGAVSLAGDAEAVWVSGGDRGTVYRIDAATDTVVSRVQLDPYVCCVAVGGGFAWAMNYRVWKLSSEGRIVSSVPIDGDGANLSWSGGGLWVAEGTSGLATRVTAVDDATRRLRPGGLVLQAAARGNIATVVVGEAPTDLLAGVRGPVARIELESDFLQPDDPALPPPRGLPRWRDQVLDASCAQLLRLRRAPPPRGWKLSPELAGLPASSDGRVWTFRISPGFRFSPPSNATVTAASMRDTIERALSPRMGPGAPAPGLLGDLVGLADLRAGRTEHVRGVRSSGNRLILELRRPAPDLPLRMANRVFCALPEGTPPSATRFLSSPIPSAGPYYVAAHFGGNALVLRRNPGYGGSRRRGFAAFLYEQAIQEPAGIDRVSRGRADLVAGPGDALGSRSPVARRFGAQARGGEPRWSRWPLPSTRLLRLRIDEGPLADRRVRRAVTLALDRGAMAALFDDDPTAQILPPGTAGWVDRPVPHADLARARAIMSGRQASLVFASCADAPECHALGKFVGRALSRIGITVRREPGARDADLTFDEETMTRPDPLGFLAATSGTRAPVPRPAPRHAARLARRADGELTRSGRVLPFGTPMIGQLASSRLGCRSQLPLSFGDDLAALCPREPAGPD